jgi:hypothetical protein
MIFFLYVILKSMVNYIFRYHHIIDNFFLLETKFPLTIFLVEIIKINYFLNLCVYVNDRSIYDFIFSRLVREFIFNAYVMNDRELLLHSNE